jgi:hypothetical protein
MLKLHKENNEAMKLDGKTPLTEEEYEKQIKDDYANNVLPQPIPFDSIFKKYGVISFCRNYKDPLMWGHYANGHNGVCVRFVTNPILKEIIDKSTKRYAGQYAINGKSELFFFWQNIFPSKKPEIIGLNDVNNYWEEHENIGRIFPTLKGIIKSSFELMLIKQIMRKFEGWKSEEETRLIFFGWHGEIIIDAFKVPTTDEPFLKMDSVFLGNNISDQSILRSLIKNSAKPNLKIKDLMPTTASYEMEISQEV